ncbi:hypothetical protein LDG_7935 [Legionella drancourtii LLAP12]|uniref:Uncharacterized protein n=1 Tax=Legionella drancourtii LLAP12 TaxID=658187 RepID=G9ERL9_9GAMM|nr:hypothetical protein LDG_7935 [Legionella drancourtii LLAP12]
MVLDSAVMELNLFDSDKMPGNTTPNLKSNITTYQNVN